MEKWLRIRVHFFTDFWLRIRVRKKNEESCRSRLRIRYHLWLRGGRSHVFSVRLRSYSKISESRPGSSNFSKLRIRLVFRLLRQPKIIHGFTSEMITQTLTTAEIEKWIRIRCQAKFLTVSGKNVNQRKYFSTPTLLVQPRRWPLAKIWRHVIFT